MKKRTIGVFTLLMILVSSYATIAVATPITNLGTIDYYNTQDNFILNGDIQGNANLTLIYSEVNGSALKLNKIWYDSFTNKTTYKFTTQKIYVEWWFTPDIKEFVYIDENSNNLYRVNVNYSQIDIPENPYEERHRQLVENYTMILNSYNLTNTTLANITLQFNELNDTYNLIMQQFNITQKNYLNVSGNLTNLTIDFNTLEDEYDNMTILWNGAVNSSAHYETSLNDKVTEYNQLEKDHNNLAGSMPWYIIITFIGTALAMFFWLRRKTMFDVPPGATDEITTGYGKLHATIDRHILSHFRKEPDTGEGKIEELPTFKEAPSDNISMQNETKEDPIKKQPQDDFLTAIHEKIDANARTTNIRIDAKAKDTDTKITTLFEKFDERLKQLAEGPKA